MGEEQNRQSQLAGGYAGTNHVGPPPKSWKREGDHDTVMSAIQMLSLYVVPVQAEAVW